ncbi:hypothetical protein CKO35_12150 [Ectothiorhodospira shaposhnikovii]|uniref:hypothetical protein n=1 Tax=Ectothiorhodospira shaposhnikovii TaxID=1054 RepID=UPI001907EF61|nr:hypothetical protein [Ectothiorhodospira shaposhnikovii]MBK1674047.1 hypothetical protein [Ectothiorhodospira shaposhnikovii]
MKHLKTGLIALVMLLALAPLAQLAAAEDNRVLVTVNSGEPQTQAMAMILTRQLVERGATVQVLLCDQGGVMGTKAYDGPVMKGPDATAQQIMRGVMQAGAKVSVCALFLPNSDFTRDDLIEGVDVATPPQMGEFMIKGTRFLNF